MAEETAQVEQERPAAKPEKLRLYVVKATKTSTHNTQKIAMICEELSVQYDVFVVQSVKQSWFGDIHPQRMVPSLEDVDPETNENIVVFESTSCLAFVADKYDPNGILRGRTVAERAAVMNWLTLETAGLGPTGKYWLLFKLQLPEQEKSLDRFISDTCKQYDILDARLSQPGQQFVALADRPSIADFAYLPFANAEIAQSCGLDINKWPSIVAWNERMYSRPAVKRALQIASTWGNDGEG